MNLKYKPKVIVKLTQKFALSSLKNNGIEVLNNSIRKEDKEKALSILINSKNNAKASLIDGIPDYMIMVDCEMTGVIPEEHELLQVAMLLLKRKDFHYESVKELNNSALASGAGGSLSDVFGSGTGYNLTDITWALYEVSTYKAMFEAPLTYNYNPYSNILVILGALKNSDLILQTFLRCKIQDLYKLYYFFRYCVCLGKRSLSTIMGTFDFKLAGGVSINHQRFFEEATTEIQEINEWIQKQRSPDYFLNSNTI
jgi:hypothetical protein